MLKCYLSPKARHAVLTRHGFCRFLGLDKPLRNLTPKRNQSAGFTLLELLVVIALLGIVALVATTYIVEDKSFEFQDKTEKRWDAIRKAIVGEPNLTLNASPYISGYVADMGRLPQSISELIEQSPSFDNDDNPNTAEILCTYDLDNNVGTADLPIQQPAWTEIDLYTADTGYSAKLGGGWRGPYLYTAGSKFYADGWVNNNVTDACDFDWVVNPTPLGAYPNITEINIQSLGRDRTPNGVGYNEDFPSNNIKMVSVNEWALSTAPITFNINFSTAAPSTHNDLELRIYRYVDNGNNLATFVSDDDITDDIEMIDADDTFNVIANDTTFAPAQTITPDADIPIGRFAAVIWCTNNTAGVYTDDAVYDGNCDATFRHSPVYFSLTRNTSQVTIVWNLP